MDSTTQPQIQLDKLLYTQYQHHNLEQANRFFIDFGFKPVKQSANLIFYRGFGKHPFIYVAERSPDNVKRFVGGGWLVSSKKDLEVASQLPGASDIQDSAAPGGGQFVDVKDPNGINMRLLFGVTLRAENEQKEEEPKPVVINTWNEKPRKGEFQRFDNGPSRVHKLGHYGLVVDRSQFETTVAWYLSTFNLAETDSLFDKASGKDMMTFMHIDKGKEFTDHHEEADRVFEQSFFIQSPPEPVKNCRPHHSSFEVDNMDSQTMGHYHLQGQGWTNCWGIGRHLLGSQIFDYWFDPSGNIVEHYSDGDIVNCETTVAKEPAAPDTMAVWGPNVTLAFLTTRMEDIKKGVAASAVEQDAVAS
ncbi:Glyoxalase/Bleomycin resistance protein/Dihydroxybiphenyl dioxygenase [Fusarium oxysporum f. sp. vasinfectum]|nr:Glyoxalase/Bleomycin resistance protein/Dihydroxybiphenyl dioxygenase [Fusarium oxysporum f. sp. vasinfectum]